MGDNSAVVKSLDDVLHEIGFAKFQWFVLLVCGLSFIADAVEVSLLSFLSECIDIEWGLTTAQEGALSSVVFAGQFFGALCWGPIADIYGRKPCFVASLLVVVTAGYGSALAPNYDILVTARFFVGIGVGAIHIPFDILAEFLPASKRAKYLTILQYFWAIGTVMIAGLAWAILSTSGWRVLTMLAAVPMTIALFASYYLPESPRWLVSQGRHEEATELLIAAAKVNGLTLEPFVLDTTPTCEAHEGTITDLLLPKYRYLNLAVWTVWLTYGFVYYGIILFVARIFIKDEDDADDGQCHFDYFSIFLSGLTEFVAVTFGLIFIPRISRNRLQSYNYLLCAVSCVCLGYVAGLESRVLFAALVRLFVRTGLTATWVATPELYPTHVRATAHATASSMTRIGGFLCPFVVINDSISLREVCMILMAVSLVAAAAAMCTPDTTNVDLDSIQPEIVVANPMRLSGATEISKASRQSLSRVKTRSESDEESLDAWSAR
jgi:putative MFS transporter